MMNSGSVCLATQSAVAHPLESKVGLAQELRALGKVRMAETMIGSATGRSLKLDLDGLNKEGLYRLPIPGSTDKNEALATV